MGLEKELNTAADLLKKTIQTAPFSLASGCELFTRFVTKTSLDIPDFEACKRKLIDRGDQFAQKSQASRAKIAQLADRFIRDGAVVLTHGFSRVVHALLLRAASQGKRFRVIVTESRPGDPPSGYKTAARLQQAQIPVTVIMDSGVGQVMESVDVVLVGAEAIVENGGIINKLGTYQLSIVASALKKPFYVAAESFKFTRMYPLNQSDLPELTAYAASEVVSSDAASVQVEAPKIDYTPPSYITLLFTELGVLTPSAVSDELIKLYY